MRIESFFSVSQQTSLFLMSVILGAALGVVYDCFRVFRIVFPPAARTAAVAVQDIIFWLIYGFSIFCYSTVAARGQIRFFTFFGSLIGFTLYIFTVGSFVTSVIRRAVTSFYGILRKVYSVTIEPPVNLLRKICQKACLVFVGSHKNEVNTERSGENHLKNAVDLVYNDKANLGSCKLKRKVRR